MDLDPLARANKILGQIDTVLGNDLFADAFGRCIAGPALTVKCDCSNVEVVQIGWTRSSRCSPDNYLFWRTIREEDYMCAFHQAEAAGVTIGWTVDRQEEYELQTCWSCSWHVYSDDDRTMTSIGLCSVCHEEIIGYRREVPTVGKPEQRGYASDHSVERDPITGREVNTPDRLPFSIIHTVDID